MDRRRFLLFLAAGLAGASVAHGADQIGAPPEAAAAGPPEPAPAGRAPAEPVAEPTGPAGPAAVDPPLGVVSDLPGEGNAIALTIDDGTNSEVVAAYTRLAADTGIRLTFFPNGCYSSWADSARELRPMIESGQVAIGNHTWSHPDLTTLGDAEVAEEIARNRDFMRRTLGVADTPFFRPPFGAHDERIDRISADQGHPTVAMWGGTLGDHTVLSGPELVGYAREWFTAQSIVIGHANHPAVTTVYGELLDLIQERGLRTVTLADVWATREQRLAGATGSASAPTG
ncbi:polysaccharide deacetylase family protein [Geodermatophilus sp. SYSU D00815]